MCYVFLMSLKLMEAAHLCSQHRRIPDDPHDFVGIKNSDFTGNASKCVMVGNNLHIPNIDSVKYVSDGRILNATVYLTQPFPYMLNSSIYRNITTSLNVGYVNIDSSVTAEDLLEQSAKDKEKYKYFKPVENKTFVTKNNYSAYQLIYDMVPNNSVFFGEGF